MHKIEIFLRDNIRMKFIGIYRRDLEKENWHYYNDEDGNLYHFRKDAMIAVIDYKDIVEKDGII